MEMHYQRVITASGKPHWSLLFLLAFMLLHPWKVAVHGQTHEPGVFFGGSHYMGELNPSIPFLMTSPAAGVLYRLNLSDHVAIRTGLSYGRLQGNNALPRVAGRTHAPADTEFNKALAEASIQLEINFLPYGQGTGQYRISPYLLGGGGGFYLFDNDNVDWSGSLLFGLGLKFRINRYLNAGLEWGMRYAFTDHIDGFTRLPYNSGITAWPFNDWYSLAGFSLTFSIPNRSRAVCPYPL